jgi:hypothetical protein
MPQEGHAQTIRWWGQFITTNATININEGKGFAYAVGSNTYLRQYFPSGRVIVSGIEQGLYVLESSFPTASHLQTHLQAQLLPHCSPLHTRQQHQSLQLERHPQNQLLAHLHHLNQSRQFLHQSVSTIPKTSLLTTRRPRTRRPTCPPTTCQLRI